MVCGLPFCARSGILHFFNVVWMGKKGKPLFLIALDAGILLIGEHT